MSEPLRERFVDLWRRMEAGDQGGRVCDQLLRAWQEPHRRYHGIDHLRDCLGQLDAAPRTEADRDAAETALWFHDAVYVSRASDNEARSAHWATRALSESGAPAPRAQEVARLVRLTDHLQPPDDPTGTLVCDIDLSILGRPAAEYAEYERLIRAEYDDIPDPLYRLGRAALLGRLLARDPLYRSAHFRNRYEVTARQNLMRSLEELVGGTGRGDADHFGAT